MFAKIVFIFLSLYGAYCIYYGVRFGLIEKAIPRNYWRHTQYIEKAAIRQGWAYIIIGLVAILIIMFALIRLNF
jgi:hypothetical protein